jgi:hypothetical protein
MKKLFITLALACVTLPSLAQHRHHGHWHHRHHHGYYGNSWIAPLVIGGVVTYALTRPEPIIVHQPPVIVQPNPTVLQNPTCTPWTETYSSDGTITRTRTCTQ